MKVILNKCYGGFGVSQEAYELYAKKKGIEIFFYKFECENTNQNTEKPIQAFQYSILFLQRILEIMLKCLMIISKNITCI